MPHVSTLLVLTALSACEPAEPATEPVAPPAPAPEPPPAPVTYAEQAEPPSRPALAPARPGAVYVRLERGASSPVLRLDAEGLSPVGAGAVDLHRAPDGSVWALGASIQRLDGDERITIPELPASPSQLALDARGRAWIAAKEGVGRWDGAAWVSTPWADFAGDDKGWAQDMLVDGRGAVWVTTLDGVYRFDGAWAPVAMPEATVSPMPGLLRTAADGTVLMSTSGGVFARSGDVWQQLDEVSARDTFDAHGGHQVRAWRKTAFLLGPDGEARLSIPDGPTTLSSATVDAAGRAWLATDVGLHLLGEEDWWHPLGVDPLRGRAAQVLASGSGPATLPKAPAPATVAVSARFVRDGAPLAGAAVELCPQPQSLYRGDSPCDGSAFRAVARTDDEGRATWPAAARAPLRVTFQVGEEWKSVLGGSFRCCGDAQSGSLDLGEVALPK